MKKDKQKIFRRKNKKRIWQDPIYSNLADISVETIRDGCSWHTAEMLEVYCECRERLLRNGKIKEFSKFYYETGGEIGEGGGYVEEIIPQIESFSGESNEILDLFSEYYN